MHQRQTLHGESRGDRQLNRRHSTTTVAATMGAQLHWWSSRTVCDNTDNSKHVDKQPQVVVGLACTGPDRCAWNADASRVVNALLQRWWSHVLIESTRCVRLSLDTPGIRHADTQWLSTMTEQGEGEGTVWLVVCRALPGRWHCRTPLQHCGSTHAVTYHSTVWFSWFGHANFMTKLTG